MLLLSGAILQVWNLSVFILVSCLLSKADIVQQQSNYQDGRKDQIGFLPEVVPKRPCGHTDEQGKYEQLGCFFDIHTNDGPSKSVVALMLPGCIVDGGIPYKLPDDGRVQSASIFLT